MKKVRVALIDTGINSKHPIFKNNKIQNLKITRNPIGNLVLSCCSYLNDFNGHGTACASVIRKECPDVEIISIQLLDQKGSCSLKELEFCLENVLDLDAEVINMSLALVDKANIENIFELCQHISKKSIIVSALGNHMSKSYPACLKSCIGVQGGILESANDFWFKKNRRIQGIVDSTPFFHAQGDGEYSMFGKCNSYAAAKLTGIIAKIIRSNPSGSNTEIINYLEDKAKRNYWNFFSLKHSRRFPMLNDYVDLSGSYLEKQVDVFMKKYLKIDGKQSLKNELLLSANMGLSYELCYGLLKEIEREFGFIVKDYTRISREDFYSINHIAHLISENRK